MAADNGQYLVKIAGTEYENMVKLIPRTENKVNN